MANDAPVEESTESTILRNSTYWFEDGSAVYALGGNAFKLHRSLLDRHSKVLSNLSGCHCQSYGVPVLNIPPQLGVRLVDFVALLEHLYHDKPLNSTCSFVRVTSILRVCSDQQLQLPSIYIEARRHFEALFPSNPLDLRVPEDPQEALRLAVEHDVQQALKPLFYIVATTSHFEPDVAHPSLTPATTARCASLQDFLISHFTPILFTVATGSHMNCTDVFAEQWMPLVIGPSLASNGVCTPIETLKRIQDIDWNKEGICEECCMEKRKEWEEEILAVWEKVDGWLQL